MARGGEYKIRPYIRTNYHLCRTPVEVETVDSIRLLRLNRPQAASPKLLPQIVGLANALDLSLTAKTVDAAEAFRIGLVNYLVPDEELMPKAYEIARSIAEKSPQAIGFARRSFYDGLDLNFEEQQKKEKMEFAQVVVSDAFRQGQKQFLEKKR
jgi:enoyl-CoA hydratase/carnithine racemase